MFRICGEQQHSSLIPRPSCCKIYQYLSYQLIILGKCLLLLVARH